MLLGRILRAVLIVAVATLALGGCRPAAQDNPLPLIVHVLPAQEGLQIEVPLCRGDLLVRASVFGRPDSYRSTEWVKRSEAELPERVAWLAFTSETLPGGTFNADELQPRKDVAKGVFESPSDIRAVQVVTSRGSSELTVTQIGDGAVTLWVVRGNDTPTPITEDAGRTVLDEWCPGASAS
jgi:hypothetical protein